MHLRKHSLFFHTSNSQRAVVSRLRKTKFGLLGSIGLSLLLIFFLFGGLANAASESTTVSYPTLEQRQASLLTATSPITETVPDLLPGKPALSTGQRLTTPVIVTKQLDRTLVDMVEEATAAPNITIWYGAEQSFGQLGNPVPHIHILGNVDRPGSITSMVYSLNGGTPQSLSLGADKRRLAERGDFNAELDINDLLDGPNTVVFTATNRSAEQSAATVTVNYTAGRTWPLPYTADWSNAANIHEVAQVVDGKWDIENGTVYPTWLAYDRLIAIGDQTWSDYEVTMPLTIHEIDGEAGFKHPSNGPGIGILLRWPGHFQQADEQPWTGWQRLGGLGWFRWLQDKNTQEISAGLQLLSYYSGQEIDVNPTIVPAFGVPYIFKMQVETVPGGPMYRFRVWEEGDPEPMEWHLEAQGDPTGPAQGSALLVAHHVNASIGNVTVRSLAPERLTLNLSSLGNGQILVDPAQADYAIGQPVTLSAQPGVGALFSGWQGDLQGSDNPVTLTLTEDMTITAHFTTQRYPLTLNTQGMGTLVADPALTDYPHGTVVTLTATPTDDAQAGRWLFAGWEGDLSGITNPAQITMDGTKVITAVFTTQIPTLTHQLTTTVDGQGAVVVDPVQEEYSHGAVVTLTAQAAPGWQFAGWQGGLSGNTNPASVVLTADRTVTAAFVPINYAMNLTVIGNGSVARTPDLEGYTHGSTVTLLATPAPGWHFASWQGDLMGNTNPANVVMTADRTITATFIPMNHTVNLTVVGNGSVTRTPDQSTYTHGSTVTLLATPANGWRFAGWQGDLSGTQVSAALLVDGPKQVTATFVEEEIATYSLLATATNGGSVQITPVMASYPAGTEVTVAAMPTAGWRFTGWTGDQTGSENPLQLTMDRDYAFQAQFTPKVARFALTAIGGGLVESTVSSGTHPVGTVITLTANPAPDNLFLGWAGDLQGSDLVATLVLDGDKEVSAYFGPVTHALTTETTGQGSIAVDAPAPYQHNQSVTITAEPEPGWRFIGWGGDLSGQTNPLTITMDEDLLIIANFDVDVSGSGPFELYLPVIVR